MRRWSAEATRLREAARVVQGFSPAPSGRAGLKACTTFIALALCIGACSSKPPEEPKDYVTKIAAERSAKDAAFAASDDPIPQPKHAQFLPLAYFPIDPDYNAPGVLKPI